MKFLSLKKMQLDLFAFENGDRDSFLTDYSYVLLYSKESLTSLHQFAG